MAKEHAAGSVCESNFDHNRGFSDSMFCMQSCGLGAYEFGREISVLRQKNAYLQNIVNSLAISMDSVCRECSQAHDDVWQIMKNIRAVTEPGRADNLFANTTSSSYSAGLNLVSSRIPPTGIEGSKEGSLIVSLQPKGSAMLLKALTSLSRAVEFYSDSVEKAGKDAMMNESENKNFHLQLDSINRFAKKLFMAEDTCLSFSDSAVQTVLANERTVFTSEREAECTNQRESVALDILDNHFSEYEQISLENMRNMSRSIIDLLQICKSLDHVSIEFQTVYNCMIFEITELARNVQDAIESFSCEVQEITSSVVQQKIRFDPELVLANKKQNDHVAIRLIEAADPRKPPPMLNCKHEQVVYFLEIDCIVKFLIIFYMCLRLWSSLRNKFFGTLCVQFTSTAMGRNLTKTSRSTSNVQCSTIELRHALFEMCHKTAQTQYLDTARSDP